MSLAGKFVIVFSGAKPVGAGWVESDHGDRVYLHDAKEPECRDFRGPWRKLDAEEHSWREGTPQEAFLLLAPREEVLARLHRTEESLRVMRRQRETKHDLLRACERDLDDAKKRIAELEAIEAGYQKAILELSEAILDMQTRGEAAPEETVNIDREQLARMPDCMFWPKGCQCCEKQDCEQSETER